ncbi:hypothetical protein DOTSEDRAFT_77677, partial [Dothistroma septosporum NZE10]
MWSARLHLPGWPSRGICGVTSSAVCGSPGRLPLQLGPTSVTSAHGKEEVALPPSRSWPGSVYLRHGTRSRMRGRWSMRVCSSSTRCDLCSDAANSPWQSDFLLAHVHVVKIHARARGVASFETGVDGPSTRFAWPRKRHDGIRRLELPPPHPRTGSGFLMLVLRRCR